LGKASLNEEEDEFSNEEIVGCTPEDDCIVAEEQSQSYLNDKEEEVPDTFQQLSTVVVADSQETCSPEEYSYLL
jgi:hypothetical protein